MFGKRKFSAILVDDDMAVVRLVGKFLELDFHQKLEVAPTSDALEAKRWIDERGCDLLISDIQMPHVDGIEMLRFAKARNAWTQALMLTAHSTLDRLNDALGAGASDYLLKPVVREDLAMVVGQTISRLERWRSAFAGTLKSKAAT